jgi:hypothetical protein
MSKADHEQNTDPAAEPLLGDVDAHESDAGSLADDVQSEVKVEPRRIKRHPVVPHGKSRIINAP